MWKHKNKLELGVYFQPDSSFRFFFIGLEAIGRPRRGGSGWGMGVAPFFCLDDLERQMLAWQAEGIVFEKEASLLIEGARKTLPVTLRGKTGFIRLQKCPGVEKNQVILYFKIAEGVSQISAVDNMDDAGRAISAAIERGWLSRQDAEIMAGEVSQQGGVY